MECVILYRNTGNGRVGYVSDGESDRIMVYANEDGARRDVPNIPILRAFPYQIVVLDELPNGPAGGRGQVGWMGGEHDR